MSSCVNTLVSRRHNEESLGSPRGIPKISLQESVCSMVSSGGGSTGQVNLNLSISLSSAGIRLPIGGGPGFLGWRGLVLDELSEMLLGRAR